MKKNFYFVQIFFTLVFFISSVFFFDLDNNIQLKNNFFAWDAFYYNEIVKNLDFNNLEISKTISPFHERILFPILYKTLHNLTGIELIYSASITNLVGVYISFTCFILYLPDHLRVPLTAVGILFGPLPSLALSPSVRLSPSHAISAQLYVRSIPILCVSR